MKKELRSTVIGFGIGLLGALALAQGVQRSLNLLVNGQPNADKAIVVNNISYVPARVLRNFGVTVTAQGNNLLLNGAAGSSNAGAAGSSNAGAAGTSQLAGSSGQLNTAYTIGKSSLINFNLVSARYSLEPVSIRSSVYSASQDEKLLALRFVIQNPANKDLRVYRNALKITAVDEKDVNHVLESRWARVGELDEYDANLKPSQRIELNTAFAVPANVRIVKLLVEGESGAPILRYDMTGKIAPLPAPYSLDGFTALTRVPAQVGQSYVLQRFSAKVEQIAFSTAPIAGREPSGGKRYLVANISVKNLTKNEPLRVFYDTIRARVIDAEGVTNEDDTMVRPSTGADFDTTLAPSAEARFNIYFEVDNNLGLKTFEFNEGRTGSASGRSFAYDLSDLR
jgi:hypothetical protein